MRTLRADTSVHGTCVAFDGRAVLIIGKSGSGKSTLGLAFLSLGATLVSDDQVILVSSHGVKVTAPPAIKGMIEARGIGILNADTVDHATLVLVVDLDEVETDRLPPSRHITIHGHDIPLQHRIEGLHFPSAIMQYLRAGRRH